MPEMQVSEHSEARNGARSAISAGPPQTPTLRTVLHSTRSIVRSFLRFTRRTTEPRGQQCHVRHVYTVLYWTFCKFTLLVNS